MKFFHVYNEECFKGLEKNGMLNKDSGFKVQNVFSVPKKRQFNNIAAAVSAMWRAERSFPIWQRAVISFPLTWRRALLL